MGNFVNSANHRICPLSAGCSSAKPAPKLFSGSIPQKKTPSVMKTKAWRALFVLTFCTMPAQAIILLGLGNSDNLTDPGSGAPFASVARLSNGLGTIGGSGIYLGNGYILTANHVGPFSSVTFDGVTTYTHDGMTPQQVGTTDIPRTSIPSSRSLPPWSSPPLLLSCFFDAGDPRPEESIANPPGSHGDQVRE